MQKIIHDNFGIQKISFQYGEDGNLQSFDALTCGEHNIYYLIYQKLYFENNSCFDLNYITTLEKYCKNHYINVDDFVSQEVYRKMSLAEVPNLNEILHGKSKEQLVFLITLYLCLVSIIFTVY